MPLLENWSIQHLSTGYVLHGTIYNDELDRFEDGEPIRTSRVKTPESELVAGGQAQTLNTLYTLGRRLE